MAADLQIKMDVPIFGLTKFREYISKKHIRALREGPILPGGTVYFIPDSIRLVIRTLFEFILLLHDNMVVVTYFDIENVYVSTKGKARLVIKESTRSCHSGVVTEKSMKQHFRFLYWVILHIFDISSLGVATDSTDTINVCRQLNIPYNMQRFLELLYSFRLGDLSLLKVHMALKSSSERLHFYNDAVTYPKHMELYDRSRYFVAVHTWHAPDNWDQSISTLGKYMVITFNMKKTGYITTGNGRSLDLLLYLRNCDQHWGEETILSLREARENLKVLAEKARVKKEEEKEKKKKAEDEKSYVHDFSFNAEKDMWLICTFPTAMTDFQQYLHDDGILHLICR